MDPPSSSDVPPDLAGPPAEDVRVPGAVRALAGAAALQPVWRNAAGGLTFALEGLPALDSAPASEHTSAPADTSTVEGTAVRGTMVRAFVKWAPHGSGLDLAAEAERLRWARAHVSVPRVLDEGNDVEGAWLVTSAVPGASAVDERWRADPARAVAAVGHGLRALHDTLLVADCPFTWAVDERVEVARVRAAEGRQDARAWHPVHRGLSVADALEALASPPAVDRLVVCHGDACAPNTLLTDDGRFSGHVDLGALGVADRWADLAVATWSTVWNYGPGWEAHLLDAYGIAPDPERTAYYRLLWDLT